MKLVFRCPVFRWLLYLSKCVFLKFTICNLKLTRNKAFIHSFIEDELDNTYNSGQSEEAEGDLLQVSTLKEISCLENLLVWNSILSDCILKPKNIR